MPLQAIAAKRALDATLANALSSKAFRQVVDFTVGDVVQLVRTLPCHSRKDPHLDHSYARTSHSSHGQTADRARIHVNIELNAKYPLNSRMAYVSVSRCTPWRAPLHKRPRNAQHSPRKRCSQ